MISGDCLIVFGQAPTAGVGKSRLRDAFEGELIDQLCLAWFEDIIRWPLPRGTARVLQLDGAWPPVAANGCRVIAQTDGDVGTRVQAAFDMAFNEGANRVVMIGTDCPTLPGEALAIAFGQLDEADVTVIPGSDGGWIALGLVNPLGRVLDGVGWSAPTTADQTVEVLRADGRQVAVLEPWYRIDDPADLGRLRADVVQHPGRAPRTARVISDAAAGLSEQRPHGG